MLQCLKKLGLLLSAISSLSSHAGVTVVQNVSAGATVWPGSPILSTMANPSSATVTECFTNGMTTNNLGQFVGGNTNLSHTFPITVTNHLLQQIDLNAGVGTATANGPNLLLRHH